MKRSIAFALALIIALLIACPLTSFADGASFYTGIMQLNDNRAIVTLSVRDCPGLAAAKIDLNHSDGAELVRVIDTGALEGFVGSKVDGRYTAAWINSAASDITGSRYLAGFIFEPKQGGSLDDFSFSLAFDNGDIFDSSLSNPQFQAQTGHEIWLDYDANGEVTSSDALCLLKCSVGLLETDELTKIICDSNGDGEITSSDALSALRKSVGLI